MSEVYAKTSKWKIITITLTIIVMVGVIGCLLVSSIFSLGSDEEVIKTFISNQEAFVKAKDYILNNNIDNVSDDSYDKQQKSLIQIFENLKYRGIYKIDGSMVYFIRESKLGFSNGVVFSSTGDKPNGVYMDQVTNIIDNWFIFKSH